jgi:hypothetical protein
VVTSAGFVAHPETWAGAGKKVGDASSSLAGVTNQLCRVLGDNWGAWGKDDIGEAFGNGADGKPGFGQAADNLLTALAQMVNLLAQTGWGMQVSGAIYVAADVASTIGAQPTQGPWRIPQPATYKLPAVSRELVPSDSPPPMWMDILGLMSSMVVGCQYPDGSFGALGDISAELKAAANGIMTIAETVQRAAGSVTSSNSGLAADTFATHARSTVSGLGWLAWQCKALASSADNLLAQKHAARIQFWASLAFLAVMFAAAQALAIFTFGASEGGFLAAVVGQGLGLRALLIFVLRMVIEGMMFSAGDDVIEQFARMHEHLQDGFSEGQFVKSAGTGALASLVTFGLARGVYLGAGSSQALKTVVTWMENDATASLSARARGVFTRVAVNTVAGTGGNVAAQAAVDQQVDLKGAVGSALSMGIIGEGTEAGTRAAIRYRISRVNADHTGSEDGTAAAGASSSAAPARPISVRAALASTVHDSGSGDTTQLAPQPSPADQSTALTGIEGPATAAVHAAMTSPATGTAADTAGGYRTPVRTVVTADVHAEPVSVTATVGGHGGPLAAEAPAGDHTDAVPGAAPAGARADASAADAGLASAQPPRPAATSVADHPGATGPDSHAAPATYDAVQAGAVGASGREVTTVSGAADPSGASGWRDDAAGIPAAGTQQPASSAGRPDLTGRPDLSGPDLAGRAGDQAVSTGRPGDAPTPDEALPAGLAPAAEVQATPSHLDWADRPNRGIVDVPDPEPAAYDNTETAVSTAMAAFPAETSDMVTLNEDGTATVWLHETTAAHWSHEHMATVAEPTGRVIGLRMSRELPAGNDDPADPEGALLAGLVRKAAAATAPLRTPSDGDLGSTRADAELLAQLTGKTARAIQGGRIAPGLADEVVGGWQRALDEGRPVILSSRDGPAQITDITDGLITVRAPDGSIEHIPAAAARDRLTGDYATVLEPLHPALPRPDPARADANEDAARSGQAAAGTHDGPAEDGQQPSLVAVAPERVQVS